MSLLGLAPTSLTDKARTARRNLNIDCVVVNHATDTGERPDESASKLFWSIMIDEANASCGILVHVGKERRYINALSKIVLS